jgi:hypothetical protein
MYDTKRPNIWTLDRAYTRMTDIGPIVVPKGFETDLASTPRQVWRAFPRWGRWSGAAIVHDYLYRTQPPGVSRLKADAIFHRLMREDRVLHGISDVIFRMVRRFGGSAWRRFGQEPGA